MSADTPQLIPFERIAPYRDARIVIRPLKNNGDPDVSNLFTDAEISLLPNSLSETQLKYVYDDPINRTGLHRLKLLNLQDPQRFLTDEKIRLQTWYGIGLATGLTVLPARSDSSKVQLIIAFDIDNNNEKGDNPLPFEIANTLIAEFGLIGKTIIQKTPNGGLHVVIAVAVNPNDFTEIRKWEERSMSESKCINNCRVSIKIKSMQISLDPTQHREKSWLRYELLSPNLVIAECPQFYTKFVDELKKQGCIDLTPDERSDSYKNNFENAFDIDAARFELTEKEILDAISIIIQDNNVVGSIYVQGSRNDVILALGGYCYYRHITLKSAQDLIAKLAEVASDTPSHHQKTYVNSAGHISERRFKG